MSLPSARQELRIAFKRIEAELPPRLAKAMRWLRHRDSHLIRIPAGLALMIGGVFSFLPVLGAWMLPLGLMLLAADVPPLQRPMARFAHWCLGLLERFRRRRSG
ncbi:conserved hypothetical protein [Bosea sp. 62]|uniref:hypothetical protein n=1 Tax=unclassified Bosea (in: a-proteobacteria) TaxID=2653178 RepID=UPI0012579EC8|nr:MULTISPECIES: hypothetical protein [unclassified Bosea (in: a-proteobacteria)]CAD5265740.1 conserved hypothetical protein [Bosea sp. 46]CAD5267693.1 conserved hypothetical protein [Bosea sp. 21B]CAD5271292.1 conserved hypothetical protein [Bosea sp. 7B]VVT55614.1 conserved hypothetical protein [Bosea sp. EC-HK365B]VXB87611.1 conserved hypothetical protein [Bosea sp. 29B]